MSLVTKNAGKVSQSGRKEEVEVDAQICHFRAETNRRFAKVVCGYFGLKGTLMTIVGCWCPCIALSPSPSLSRVSSLPGSALTQVLLVGCI